MFENRHTKSVGFTVFSSRKMWTNHSVTPDIKKPSGAAMLRFLNAKKDPQGRRRAQ
jgi:hypothetical protein